MTRKKPFLIAEIGINHNGSLKIAKKLIDLAKKYNFDAVKFQKRVPKNSVPEKQKNVIRNTPWGQMTYLQYKEKIEFSHADFKKIDAYCRKSKIVWFASPWDIESAKFLKKFNLRFNKIASSMITHKKLLREVAKQKKITFISTGMSTMKNIKDAVKIFKSEKCKFILMHCVSTYPCEEKNLNLNMIKTLKDKFKCDVGYSGHEPTVSPSIGAWFLGADYIERHITLDRTIWGTDQAASLSEPGIRELSEVLRKANDMLGDGKKKILKEEKKLISKFRYW